MAKKLAKGHKPPDLVKYWNSRASQYGIKAVFNLAHSDTDLQKVTERQKALLFPLLREQLSNASGQLLDFGCGPGRFTPDLARITGATATGVDVVPQFLALAPKASNVQYQLLEGPRLPFSDGLFHVTWSCLVLGGIPDASLPATIEEIDRTLAPGGLFFFIENTAQQPDVAHWFFRSQKQYLQIASFCTPVVLASYVDEGQPITVFAGRKPVRASR